MVKNGDFFILNESLELTGYLKKMKIGKKDY